MNKQNTTSSLWRSKNVDAELSQIRWWLPDDTFFWNFCVIRISIKFLLRLLTDLNCLKFPRSRIQGVQVPYYSDYFVSRRKSLFHSVFCHTLIAETFYSFRATSLRHAVSAYSIWCSHILKRFISEHVEAKGVYTALHSSLFLQCIPDGTWRNWQQKHFSVSILSVWLPHVLASSVQT